MSKKKKGLGIPVLSAADQKALERSIARSQSTVAVPSRVPRRAA
jgi:hypothetical protein